MSSINLQDTFVLDGVRKTEGGYLTAFARVARTGVQVYKGFELGRPDLDQVRVYRPPEEVFHVDALRSLAHRPVTLRHPPAPVNAKNWKQYAGGQTGEDVVRDGDFVRVPMVMMDAALIDAYERGGIKELSVGYSTDIKWTKGVVADGQPDAGQHYDAVQTEIRGNHLAVVPVARGGDQLRIGDGGTCPECGAEMQGTKCSECNYVKDGELTMKIITLDGFSVSVADDQSASIVQRVVDGLTAQLKTVTDSFEDLKKKKKDDEKEVADAKALVSAKDGEIAVLNQKIKDAEITPAKLDALVKDRMTVVDSAARLLGKDFAFDGKTLVEIKRAAVEVKLGDAAKSMDDAAIGGAFAALAADAPDTSGTRPIVDSFQARRPGGASRTHAADEAYEASTRALENAWKTPAQPQA